MQIELPLIDPAKEHSLILDPHGEFFEILGVQFDIKLTMYAEVSRTANEASRRCHIVSNLRRFYNVCALFRFFKAHVLSYIERSTPAIFHCSPSILCLLDNVQLYFLDVVQTSLKDVLLHFNLAPLGSRRHISMLGLIHKSQFGIAPTCLSNF